MDPASRDYHGAELRRLQRERGICSDPDCDQPIAGALPKNGPIADSAQKSVVTLATCDKGTRSLVLRRRLK
jgi:hypothetical protein